MQAHAVAHRDHRFLPRVLAGVVQPGPGRAEAGRFDQRSSVAVERYLEPGDRIAASRRNTRCAAEPRS